MRASEGRGLQEDLAATVVPDVRINLLCISFFWETVDNQEQSKKLRPFPLLVTITSLFTTPHCLITNPIIDFLFNSPLLSNRSEG